MFNFFLSFKSLTHVKTLSILIEREIQMCIENNKAGTFFFDELLTIKKTLIKHLNIQALLD